MKTLHMLHPLDLEVGKIGSTVRLGFKWAEDMLGVPITLCVCDGKGNHEIVGEGSVSGTWVGRFCDIPAYWIRNEHEISSRNFNGLFDSMKRAYGNKFGETSFVTVLMYHRLK